MHEYIGVTGYLSKTGELNHLALVTWVLPVEAMDEESQRNFHESEVRVAEEIKELRGKALREIADGTYFHALLGFVGAIVIFIFTACIGGWIIGLISENVFKLYWNIIKYTLMLFLLVLIRYWILSCLRLCKPKY